MDIVDTAICVPTFRRPQSLTRCLTSLARLRVDRPFRVIVADNDSQAREGRAAVEKLVAQGIELSIDVIDVDQRGIAPTRNDLVKRGLQDPDIKWIAMIDDDEWAEPDWLSELLRTQASFHADVVGGPVQRVFEVPVPDYVAVANQYAYGKMKAGPIELVDATSNILFMAELFRSSPAPWFDPQYALMGCEDKDFLLGLKLSGKTFAWAAEAKVQEEMPASRSSVKWMLQRAYRVGNTDTIVNLKHKPPGFTPVAEGARIGGALAVALFKMFVLGWNPSSRFEGARLGARVVGKIVALTGRRHEEYRVIHGR